MPSRRAILGVLATLTGCSSTSPPTDQRAGATPTSVASAESATPSPSTTDYWSGPCDARDHDWVDPASEDIEPKSLPERPDDLGRLSAKGYVEAYERAYLYNSILQRGTVRAGAIVDESEVASMRGGFVVRVRSWYTETVRGTETANGTATAVHADGPQTWKAYLVTAERLVRAEGEYDSAPDPRKTGTTVECYDG